MKFGEQSRMEFPFAALTASSETLFGKSLRVECSVNVKCLSPHVKVLLVSTTCGSGWVGSGLLPAHPKSKIESGWVSEFLNADRADQADYTDLNLQSFRALVSSSSWFPLQTENHAKEKKSYPPKSAQSAKCAFKKKRPPLPAEYAMISLFVRVRGSLL